MESHTAMSGYLNLAEFQFPSNGKPHGKPTPFSDFTRIRKTVSIPFKRETSWKG